MKIEDVIAFAARVGLSAARGWLADEGQRLSDDAVERLRAELARLLGHEIRVDAARLVIVDERDDDPTI